MKILKFKDLMNIAESNASDGKNQIKFIATSSKFITTIVILYFISKFNEIYVSIIFYDSDYHSISGEKELLDRTEEKDPLSLVKLTVEEEAGFFNSDSTRFVQLGDPIPFPDNRRKGETHLKYGFIYQLNESEFNSINPVDGNEERSKVEIFPVKLIINEFLNGKNSAQFFDGHLDFLRNFIKISFDEVREIVDKKISQKIDSKKASKKKR